MPTSRYSPTRYNRVGNVIKLVRFTLNTLIKRKVDKDIIHIESTRIYTTNLMYSYLFDRFCKFCVFCVPNLMTLIAREQRNYISMNSEPIFLIKIRLPLALSQTLLL